MSLQNCSNCYNGCTEIVSDKCVRYTGIDVPVLGIQTGDSLSYVEQSLITFLVSTLDGTGIKPLVDLDAICDFVKGYLPTCGDITIVDLVNALIDSTCFLKDEVIALEAKFAELEQGYSTQCLEGSPDPTNTYEVLQATINKLCALEIDLGALALDVEVNYVRLDELNALIQAYLDGETSTTKYYSRMVPYTVVEYYGSLSNFDASGAGLGDWEQIYLCNGANGTPDKRGRSPIGALNMPGGDSLPDDVNPLLAGNFNYVLYSTNGANTVTLSTLQMPSHTHTATATSTSVVTPNPHNHGWTGVSGTGYPDGSGDRTTAGALNSYPVTAQELGVSLAVATSTAVSVGAQGGGQSHNNVHPVIACYYIMYIPAP
jgi:microcystin-dependent protein